MRAERGRDGLMERSQERRGENKCVAQVVPGTRQEAVSLPASETRGRSTLGNSVGDTHSTLRRFQCEILVSGPDSRHAFTLPTSSQDQRDVCLHLKDKQELRLSYDTLSLKAAKVLQNKRKQSLFHSRLTGNAQQIR